MDITSYLVLHTSYYTASQMKAYKSLEAFNYFVCGWVNDLGTKEALNKCRLVFARVNHSQRSGETPLKTWIVAKEDGEVVTAHCNCMAGLSESCSHVGAVLFAIEAGVKMRETASCTTEKCKWLMPSHVKKVFRPQWSVSCSCRPCLSHCYTAPTCMFTYMLVCLSHVQIPAAPVAMIDFSSAKSKKQKLDDAIAGRTGEKHTFQRPTVQGSKLERGSERYMQFFKTLSRNSPRSAALMSREPYYRECVPKSVSKLPKPLPQYRTPEMLQLSPTELQNACQDFRQEELTQPQVQAVEEETRNQSLSAIWFSQRAGRITASRLKQVLQTSLAQPSKSLIKSICYPEAHKFSTAATRYLLGIREPIRKANCIQFFADAEGYRLVVKSNVQFYPWYTLIISRISVSYSTSNL
ncbi:uncharacterized protein LOC117546338 isoform X1 [Gymnodraco acuticeps]|uniref:Uncharacterized protein LOC117546338 isoform X1 n=1 Tax=Gymnodraco acuticeps TaxID=8218 RepID=A0A6P8UKJ1_GYMAC|nr:uncharacterized protein LOC117546338 isoform X1 [Gymnodraco acuticeps]